VLSLASVPLWLWAVPTGLSGASLAAILWQGLYQGVAVGVVSILLFTRCVALIGPVRAAMFIPLMPLTTAAAGMLVLGEWPQPLEWAGMIVVLAGMMLALGGPARAGQ
jgi:drug/metabolite transporter (DMT)-like permease